MVKNRRQPTRIEVTQSLNAVITTIGVETVVVPNTHVVKRGIVIRSTIKLSHESDGFSAGRNLNRSSRLPTSNTRVVGTP